ncbi:hypothetical protein OIU84_028190 [Salix udensis]|uniref:Uncharacterized protein n=1 Tax=Salix udensis TaxID=889485 RepID=A0AAD6P947_9ROSI|nr:hypothetical protein OIU84_028190 [Salix udensis]
MVGLQDFAERVLFVKDLMAHAERGRATAINSDVSLSRGCRYGISAPEVVLERELRMMGGEEGEEKNQSGEAVIRSHRRGQVQESEGVGVKSPCKAVRFGDVEIWAVGYFISWAGKREEDVDGICQGVGVSGWIQCGVGTDDLT